jgi:hypothetical protein
MKLIDVLVEELPKRGGWPSLAKKIHQDYDGEVWGWIDEGGPLFIFTLDQIATNARQQGKDETYENMVTREQYEAALAAKNDGWIEWGGGECPVPGDTEVLIKCKSEGAWDYRRKQRADEVAWTHDDSVLDVIAYRLHKPQEVTEADEEADLNDCIGQGVAQAWNGYGLPPVGCECQYTKESFSVKGWTDCTIDYVGVSFVVFRDCYGVELTGVLGDIKFRPIRSEADKKREEAIMSIAKAGGAAPFKYGEKFNDGSLIGAAWYELYDAIAAGKIPGVKLED